MNSHEHDVSVSFSAKAQIDRVIQLKCHVKLADFPKHMSITIYRKKHHINMYLNSRDWFFMIKTINCLRQFT